MKKIYSRLFLTAFLLTSTVGFATQHTVTTSGFTFTPSNLAANEGDTVNFVLSGIHDAIEVSQSTWNIPSNLPHVGFTVPFGGGMVILNQVKTYYYVCDNHFSFGMKGQIVVSPSTGINSPAKTIQGLEIYPNPAVKWVTIKANLSSEKENQLKIFNIIGNCLYERENISSTYDLNLAGLPSGVYFVEIRSENLLLKKKLILTR